jgi:CHAT domain-containing protein
MDKKTHEAIQALAEQNKIKESIDAFRTWATDNDKQELSNSLILLKSRYNQVKRQESMGIIRLNQALPEYAFVMNSLLSFLNDEMVKSTSESSEDSIPSDAKKTILFLASMPTGEAKLQLEKEFTRIHSNLQEKSHLYELNAEWAVKPSDLQKAILKYRPNIIHFSGHGIDGNQAEESGLLLEDNTGKPKFVTATALTNMFKILIRKIPIEMVVLNACFTQAQAEGISKHIPFVIGMNTRVEDDTAIEFSTGFYRGLLEEEDVEFAFDLAVNAIQLEGLSDDDVPVLLKG